MTESRDATNLAGIPEAARPLWGELLAEPLRSLRELIREVRDYRRQLLERSQWLSEEVDLPLATKLADVLLRLLATLSEQSPEATRRLAQAAVRYFVIEDDAMADQSSLAGFDDDAAVVNAVLRELGHEGWVVPVS